MAGCCGPTIGPVGPVGPAGPPSVITARVATTDDTPADLELAGGVPITLPDNSTWAFTVFVAARNTLAPDESAGYKFEGVIDRQTGVATTAFVGAPVATVLGEDVPAWDATVSADVVNGALAITVTGELGKTIQWVASIQITESVD